MSRGRIAGELEGRDITEDAILRRAMGLADTDEERVTA